MTSDRKKPGMAFWTTVVLVVVLVGYPLSFGPACWWFSTANHPVSAKYGDIITLSSIDHRYAPSIYWPIGWTAENGPAWLSRAIRWYAKVRIERIYLPVDSSGRKWSGA